MWVLVKRKRAPLVRKKEKYEEARALAAARLAHFNTFYNFTYNQVRIRNQKTRWGSCSQKGNLNFTYKLILLSSRLVDYVIVHELCHLEQMNHSPKFWELVSQTIPDYKARRRELLHGTVRLG
jgi:predicted metal-dependent hydrolase